MFILIAFLAFANSKNDALIKAEEEEGGHSSKPSDSLMLILENLNDVLNGGINKETILRYFNEEEAEELLNTYISYINMISNKSLVLYPNKYGYFSKYINTSKTLSSIGVEIEDFLNSNKDTFKTIQPIISELGPDLAKVINVDFSTLEQLYKYILIDQTDGVRFGRLLEILGISTNWVLPVQKVVSAFDDSKPISTFFEGLGVTNEYNDVLNKVKSLNVTDDNTKFLSIDNAANVITSAFKLVRAAYNNFVKKHYDDAVLPLIKKYGLKTANIFETSVKTRATSLVNIINKVQSYSSYCKNDEDLNEPSTLNDFKCLVYAYSYNYLANSFCMYYDFDDGHFGEFLNETCAENIYDTVKGYFADYTNAEINFTSFLVDKYEFDGNTVKLISGLIADAMDPTKSLVNVLENSAKYLSEAKVFDISYTKFAKNIKYAVEFFTGLGDSSNFYQLFLNLGLTDYWRTAVKYVQEVSVEKPFCNLSFLYDEYYFDECQEQFYTYVQYIKHYLSDDALLSDLIPEEGIISQLIRGAIPAIKDFKGTLPAFLKSAYEKVAPKLILELLNITVPNTVDFTKLVTKTSEIVDDLFSLVDFLFPCITRELPFVSQYYPKFMQKTHEILGAFKNSQTTIPSIANSFYDGIGVIFDMLASAASAVEEDFKISINSILNKVRPTSFLDLGKTAAELKKIDNLTLHNIAKAITYDGSSNGAKLLAGSRTLSINDVAPYKTLILNSGELYNNMNSRKLNFDLFAKSLGASKDDLKEKFKSIASPAVAIPRQIILNIVKNYTRTNDDNKVGSYFDKIRLLARSVEAGSLISTNTDGIVATPMPTIDPDEEDEPPIENDYQESEILGETEFVSVGDKVTINQKLNEKFDQKGGESGRTYTVEFEVDSDGPLYWDDSFRTLGDDEFVSFIGLENIELSDAKLNYQLPKGTTNLKVNVSNAGNVQLSLKVEDNQGNGPATIQLNTEEDTNSITVSSNSKIADVVEIQVQNKVTSVTIQSVDLHNTGKISVKNEDGYNIPLTIRNLNVGSQTSSELTNVKIDNSLEIKQSSTLTFNDVQFNKDAQMKINLLSYSSKQDKTLITGTLKSPPKEIVLTKPTSGTIVPGHNYALIEGSFENKCSAWHEKLKIGDTDFKERDCINAAGVSTLAEAESLVVRIPAGKNQEDGNKLSVGQIAGIVVGCVVGVAIIVIVVVVVIIKKKKNDQSSNENGNDEAEP